MTQQFITSGAISFKMHELHAAVRPFKLYDIIQMKNNLNEEVRRWGTQVSLVGI